jgi:hypothetical protein
MGEFLSALGRTNRDALSGDVTGVLLVSDFTPNALQSLALPPVGRALPPAQVRGLMPPQVHDIDYKPIVSAEPIDNAAIIEAHAGEIADGRLTLNVTVANYGQVEQKRLLTAKVNASESVLTEVSLSANQHRTYQAQIDIGASEREQLSLPIELSLSSGDGLRQDDTFYLAISTPQRKTLTVILAGAAANQTFLVGTALDTLSRMNSHGVFKIRQLLLSDLAIADLELADILICSAIAEPLGHMAPALRNFVQSGGRIIFFLTGEPAYNAMARLWQQDVLPALPRKYTQERIYVAPKPSDERVTVVDSIAAKALSNYRIDNIAFKGCWQCEQHPQGKCLWKFKNGSGFVYLRSLGDGTSILVNTSADDSLGSLTKSSASVAFCQYLLGAENQMSENCFAYGEPVVLSMPGVQKFDIPAGDRLSMPESGGIGWVKTLGKPAIYAGVNLPQGETDMTKPVSKELSEIMSRVFQKFEIRNLKFEISAEGGQTPLWKIFAWTLILLLLLEPAIANRLKR